jgi:hypothetical protein
MDALIAKLEEVQQYNNIKMNYDSESGKFFYDSDDDRVAEISELAGWLLFDDRGRIIMEEKQQLQRSGYRMIMVRSYRDSITSGWLIAGLEIEFRGVIAFENDFLFRHIENRKIEKQIKGEF